MFTEPDTPPRPSGDLRDPSDAGTTPDATSHVSPEVAVRLAETFKALGDPSRVRILDVLSRGETCVSEISRLIGSSESAVSHQLRLLRSLRLVRARRAGRLIFYTLDDHHIVKLFAQGLEHVQERLPIGPQVENRGRDDGA